MAKVSIMLCPEAESMRDLRMGILGIASFGVALGTFMTALVHPFVLPF